MPWVGFFFLQLTILNVSIEKLNCHEILFLNSIKEFLYSSIKILTATYIYEFNEKKSMPLFRIRLKIMA